jgi:tetratricopeptide (TPR) repeat protein
MAKPNDIRKKALEYAKRRQWDKALEEYVRLAEADAQNPNVYNELGDLYLQTENKIEAFKAFHSAVDAYGKMGLFNNAVAVCKKIIRLNSVDRAVYGKLARLRNKQGLKKEAGDYAVSFIEKMEKDATAEPEEVRRQVVEIAGEIGDVTDVLERAARFLTLHNHTADAAKVLERLTAAYQSQGMTSEAERTRLRMAEMGHTPARPTPAAAPVAPSARPIATATGTEKPRMDPPAARPAPAADSGTPTPSRRAATPYDYGSVDLGGPAAEEAVTATETEEVEPAPPRSPRPDKTPPRPEPAAQPTLRYRTAPPQPEPGPAATPAAKPVADAPSRPSAEPLPSAAPASSRSSEPLPSDGPARSRSTEPLPSDGAPRSRSSAEPLPSDGAPGPSRPLTDTEVWVPADDLPDGIASSEDGAGRIVQVSELVNHFHAEVKADVDAEDYRSRYDLGMAYLEMDLITEAIREFQFAANSSMYQVRSLELIGLCFIKQNQPRLAVKQLEKGLSLVGNAERDAIGLYYNLGLAYELMGDRDKAKRCFEEVYVIDVGFRDVADKMKSYS